MCYIKIVLEQILLCLYSLYKCNVTKTRVATIDNSLMLYELVYNIEMFFLKIIITETANCKRNMSIEALASKLVPSSCSERFGALGLCIPVICDDLMVMKINNHAYYLVIWLQTYCTEYLEYCNCQEGNKSRYQSALYLVWDMFIAGIWVPLGATRKC